MKVSRLTGKLGWAAIASVGIALLAALAGVIYAGPLDPPAGVTTSTSTQEQLIFQPIGCAGFPITISTSGTYKLAQDINLGGCGVDGIAINTSEVTLDLNGFNVHGSAGGPELACIAGTTTHAVTIKNGVVQSCDGGGIVLGSTTSVTIDSVDLNANAIVAIRTSSFANIRNCTVENNPGSGIEVGVDSVIDGCTVAASGTKGISVGTGSVVTNTASNSNGDTGIYAKGTPPFAAPGVTITNCTASGNGGNGIHLDNLEGGVIQNCSTSNNALIGIVAETGALVSGNTATQNGQHGIAVDDRNAVLNNNVENNGNGPGTWSGIRANGIRNRIEGNNVSANDDTGISVGGVSNLIIRNSASGEVTPFAVPVGNFLGTVVATEAAMNGAPNADVNIAMP